MAVKKLNQDNRAWLYNKARERILETQDKKLLDSTYKAAANVVASLVVKKFPQADMAVLERYKVARHDRCVYISTGGGDYQRFEFRENDKNIPLSPGEGCNRRTPYLLDDKQALILKAYFGAQKDHDKAIEVRTHDFRNMIYTVKTFEALATLWPGAEAYRDVICGPREQALSVMSSEVLARITADPALNAA